jgi:hypothetical protein
MVNQSAKYRAALAVAARAGWRFTCAYPRSNILYSAMMMSGYQWSYVDKTWVKRRTAYVVLKEATA